MGVVNHCPYIDSGKVGTYACRCQETQVLVIATARNKLELNRELLTSQGTHTFDRVLEIEPPTLVSGK